MNILLQPHSLSLVGSMNHVIIMADNEVSFVLSDSGGNAIVKHVYAPSETGRIEVDLKNIILPLLTFKLQDVSSPYQQSGIAKSFSVTVTETGGGETKSFSFTVIRAGVDHFDGDAESFLTQNFLTWQPNVKPVTYYTPEFLTYYAVVMATIRCKAYFEDGTTQTIDLAQIPAGECWTVPVQYAVIAGKVGDKLPQYYEVWAENASGSRLTYIQRYVASDMRSEEEEWILFENSLGGIDTFRAYGDSENTAKHTHNVAEIEETYEEYRVDTTREYKKNTGYLGNRERAWLLDFFPSTGKYVYTDNFIRRIVVTESDVSYNAKKLPSDYSFTYKYADAQPYLNLPRAELPQKVLNIKVPDLGSFTVAPRLAEFPHLTLSGGALFPVENPYSDQWNVTTAGAILDYIVNGIVENYSGDGGIGHTHPNINLLNSMRLAEDYLLVNGNKIKAGYADKAKDLAEDSLIWKKFLRKDKEDVASKVITFLEGIISKAVSIFHAGWKTATYDGDTLFDHGARVGKDGDAVLDSLFVRKFISAPKFVFNEINVTKAEQWNTNAYGTIECVDTQSRLITLHLEENEYGSVEVGDICRGIFADIDDAYKSDGNTEGDLDDCNFVVHRGFFTTYFTVEKIVTSKRGQCVFQYRKRSADTPDPCAYMDFAQYGSFTDSSRQSSMYLSSRGHSYIEVLDGVNNWEIQPQNRVCRYGWLGNLTIENDDGARQNLSGNGLFAQNHVYFGGDIIKLSNISDLEDLQKMAGAYDVSLSRYQGVITVDDMGNVLGGLYTLADAKDDSGSTIQVKQWQLSTAVFVRKGQDILLEEDPGNELVTEGHYRVTAFGDGCECEIANSTVYITSIKNLRDGIANTEDEIDYDAMRKMRGCRVSIVVELEGKTAKTIEFPVRISHDPLPFLACDLDNEHSSVSWNTKAQEYTGFPVISVASLMHYNELWQVDKDSHINGLPDGLKADVSFPGSGSKDNKKMVVSITTDGTKTGDFLATRDGRFVGTKHDISVHIIGTYAGARYEYNKVLTIDRLADTTVYELIPSSSSIVMDKGKNLSVNRLTCEVWATSSDDKRYKVEDLSAAGLEIKYCKGDGTPDTAYDTYVSVTNADKSVTFGLFDKASGEKLDVESVPIVAWGEDGETAEITSSVCYSSVTNSSTQPDDGTFTLNFVPRLSQGSYLWCREITTYIYKKNTSLNTSSTRYWVSRIGYDGDTGDGIHVAYATSSDGRSNFSTTWFSGATYIGINVSQQWNDPTSYTQYEWSRIKGEPGDPGTPATYYEARFSEQRAAVYVEQGFETGYVSVSFKGSFYLVEGDSATKASGSGLGLKLEFLNETGGVVVTRTASVDGSSFSFVNSSKLDIQSNYRNQGTSKITSCRYTVTCNDGRDAKSGVVPIGFNAGSVFYHTDTEFESLLQDELGNVSEFRQTLDGFTMQGKEIHITANYKMVLESGNNIVINGSNFKVNEDGTIEATNGKFSGEITASSGKIGPFSIGPDGLYNGDYTKWFGGDANFVHIGKNSIWLEQAIGYNAAANVAHLKVGIGEGSDPTSQGDQDAYCASAMYIYRQMNSATDVYRPAVQIISDNVVNRDIALRVVGGVQVYGGIMERGYSMEYRKSSDANMLDLSFGTRFLLYTSLTSKPSFFIPTLSDLRKQLGITSTSQAFCVRISVTARKDTNQMYIATAYKSTSSVSRYESGYLVNNDGGEWESSQRSMQAGDCLVFDLCYTSSTGYYAQLVSVQD